MAPLCLALLERYRFKGVLLAMEYKLVVECAGECAGARRLSRTPQYSDGLADPRPTAEEVAGAKKTLQNMRQAEEPVTTMGLKSRLSQKWSGTVGQIRCLIELMRVRSGIRRKKRLPAGDLEAFAEERATNGIGYAFCYFLWHLPY